MVCKVCSLKSAMKNNQVYLDPQNVEGSMQQLDRFYRLDETTTETLRRIVECYPKPVIMYVDEANAPMVVASPLDDLFTFNTETGELVLFSADPGTFVDALIEMWMFISGFDTLLGDDDYWKIEFAIGAWKPVRDNIKRNLNIPVSDEVLGVVGLPPEPDEAPLEDAYPFKTLVSTLNFVSFTQMIRLAGRRDIRVHFPDGTDQRVREVYRAMRRAIQQVGMDLGIEDVALFNRRLRTKLQMIERRFQPKDLPMPKGWNAFTQDHDAASGPEGRSDSDDSNEVGLMLGPPDEDEPAFGRLNGPPIESDDPDRKLAEGPFGAFIDTLFDD
jgi:hypothetical protein